MTLDPRFICSSDLESVFLDKLTALPLAAGIVKFYSDKNPSLPKSVYRLSGSPPYNLASFVSIGTQVTLNAAGGYQYLGDAIALYYFPFECTSDGDPTTAKDVSELYYVTVENSGNTQQFTRYAWPPLASNLAVINQVSDNKNFIPNGQFLYYNANPITVPVPPNDITYLAQGGWSFRKTTGGTGIYNISFESTLGGGGGLPNFPPNAIRLLSSSIGTETIHDIFLAWRDVNTFSKVLATAVENKFSFSFKAKVNAGVAEDFNIYLVRNFGTGGDIYSSSKLVSVITGSYASYSVVIDMPDNTGIPVSPGSYVAIAIRNSSSGDVSFTDFSFLEGIVSPVMPPIQTNADSLSEGIAGWMTAPNPDGSDLYLPLILTQQGMMFDHSIVGQIIAKTQITALPGELSMNTTGGASYVASGYNAVTGIPYSRLMSYLLLNSASVSISGTASILANTIPMMGTGPQFVTLFNSSGGPTIFLIQMNTIASGGSATQVSASITIAATSINNYYTATVVSVPAAGNYWTFTAPTSGLVYNVWYSFNGAGLAPATPSGANILVALITGDTTTTVANKTIAAVNQYQFYIPNLSGMFLRGLDLTGIYDVDHNLRIVPSVAFNAVASQGSFLGSLEGSAFLQHNHNVVISGAVQNYAAGGASSTYNTTSGNTSLFTSANAKTGGGTETRPVNFAVNFFIKY